MQPLVDAIRRMVNARRCADYYLDGYRHIGHHVEFANEAQRAYTEADTLLKQTGLDNQMRQTVIHAIHEMLG